MSLHLPGLLQPWGIIFLAAIAAISFLLALLWYRREPGRPALHLDVACVSLLAFLTGGFFWRPLTESKVWMPAGGGDFASFYYPTYSYVAQQIKSGTIPLWNPHLFAGMPLAADVQSAIFYPLNWLLFLFVNVDYGSLEWLLIRPLLAGRDVHVRLPSRLRPEQDRLPRRGHSVRLLRLYGSPLRAFAHGPRRHLVPAYPPLHQEGLLLTKPDELGLGGRGRAVHRAVAPRGPRSDIRVRAHGSRATLAPAPV